MLTNIFRISFASFTQYAFVKTRVISIDVETKIALNWLQTTLVDMCR